MEGVSVLLDALELIRKGYCNFFFLRCALPRAINENKYYRHTVHALMNFSSLFHVSQRKMKFFCGFLVRRILPLIATECSSVVYHSSVRIHPGCSNFITINQSFQCFLSFDKNIPFWMFFGGFMAAETFKGLS